MSRAIRARTLSRVEALQRLIERMRAGELLRDDAERMLKVSCSGARAYFGDLERAHIAAVVRREGHNGGIQGKPVYGLIADDAKIARFLVAAQREPRKQERRALVSAAAIAAASPNRRFHILQDDTPFRPTMRVEPVLPDPFALPAAFFGRGGLEARA